MRRTIAFILVHVQILLLSVTALSAEILTPVPVALTSSATCTTSEDIVSYAYLGSCGLTNSTSFTLSHDKTITNIRVWYNTGVGGSSLAVTLSGPNSYNGSATLPKNSSCQSGWCEANWALGQTLPHGNYTLVANSASICSNPSGLTTLVIRGCSASAVTTAVGATKAKIYLGSDDNFTVGNSGATLYGSSGTDTVTIATGMSGVILDQNVERINLSGAAGSYSFKQTGNKITLYDASGTTLLVSVPVQGDSDGTLLSFSNGTASVTLSGGVMTVGGATVSSTAATTLTPTTTANTPVPTTATKAKVYLGTDDNFSISSSGSTLYGGTGNDAVTIAAGKSAVILDQNVERINLPGAAGGYSFKQTGNKINVYDAGGVTLLVTVPVQGDADGTVLGFSDGSIVSALLAGGVMTVGGITVPQ
jgi:hypothetical protein